MRHDLLEDLEILTDRLKPCVAADPGDIAGWAREALGEPCATGSLTIVTTGIVVVAALKACATRSVIATMTSGLV